MATKSLRVRLGPDTDLLRVVEDVHRDGVTRVIERDGEELARVIPPRARAGTPSVRYLAEDVLAFAGAWKDIDADKMIEDIYHWRHAMPPSAPVEL